MSNILITGAGGFIGSHLVERCVELGHNVTAFIKYNSKNNWGWLEYSKFKDNIKIYLGDVRDYDSVNKAMEGCDSVFHLAALIGIPYSYISPLGYIKTNVVGTYNILEAVKNRSMENLIITSTSETYGTAQYVPIDENHPVVGQSPYSATKISADQLAISYFRSFNIPVKIVRPFNTYGPRQSSRAIIPTIITQILSRNENLILGNLTPTRDLTFVSDTIEGFVEVFKSEKLFGEVVNVGMNEEISILNLANIIVRLLNKNIKICEDNDRIRPEKSEVQRLMCNNEKIKKNTGWLPKYTLEEGLKLTIEFIEKNLHFYKNIYNV